MSYRFAPLSPEEQALLSRLQEQFQRQTGHSWLLLACEVPEQPAPGFNDLQYSGPPENKQNIFHSPENLYGNITQWHI
jgi:hypothetical protein